MPVVAELNIIPLGKGVSVATWLVPAVRALETRGVKYEVTPMSTVFEAASVADAFEVAQAAHEAVVRAGVMRVVTTLKLDATPKRRAREPGSGRLEGCREQDHNFVIF